jgi:hypothetical protein
MLEVSNSRVLLGAAASVAAIQSSLQSNGNAVTTIKVYDDFWKNNINFKTGFWGCHQKTSDFVGSHDVVIVGWENRGNTQVWKVKNSWGSGWGDAGYFYVQTGCNAMEIEQQIAYIGGASSTDNWGLMGLSAGQTASLKAGGSWSDDALQSNRTRRVTALLAAETNDTVISVSVSEKQVVAGVNQHVTFTALGLDGRVYNHNGTVWLQLDGSASVVWHDRSLSTGAFPHVPWLRCCVWCADTVNHTHAGVPVVVIVACVCGGVLCIGVVVGIVVRRRNRRRRQFATPLVDEASTGPSA